MHSSMYIFKSQQEVKRITGAKRKEPTDFKKALGYQSLNLLYFRSYKLLFKLFKKNEIKMYMYDHILSL